MRKFASRLFLFAFTIAMGMFLFAKPAEAGFIDWWKNLSITQKVTENAINSGEVDAPNSMKHVWENSTDFLSWMSWQSMGGNSIAYIPGLSPEEVAQLREEAGGGAIGDINKGIVAMYNPPASTQTYVADLLESARIIPEAQAQGLGFSSLDPILETWKAFRNVAYLFFVVIFLVIGFMIMFRSKVGQAAITVQQAIPSILIALLAVTFSYAIAGFLIDLMYLMMYMLAGLFSQGMSGNDIIQKNFFQIVGTMMNGTWGSAKDGVKDLMTSLLEAGWVGEAIGWITGLSGAVIVGIAILIGSFKIFFELLKSYVSIILQVVFAPIILMMDAMPGQNKFMAWVKNIVGNLVMWPIVLICILVQRMLTQNSGGLSGSASGFMPPFLLGQGQGSVFPVLVGVGILLVIPEIMQQAKKALGVEDGVFGGLAKSAWGQIKSVPKTMGKINEAQPFDLFSDTNIQQRYLKTSGKETVVEKLIAGSRAERAERLRRLEQERLFGKETSSAIRFGGALGMVRAGEESAKDIAEKTAGGKGADKA